MRIKIIAMVFFVISVASVYADTIYLKNGKVIKGTVKSKDAYSVVVDTGGGFLDKFFVQEIDHIDGPNDNKSSSTMVFDNTQAKDLLGWKIDLITSLLEANGMKAMLEKQAHQIISNAPSDRKKEFRKLFDINKILEVVVPIYGKYFSEDELRQMLQFYQSPAGKKLTRLTPVLTNEVVNAVVSYFKEHMRK